MISPLVVGQRVYAERRREHGGGKWLLGLDREDSDRGLGSAVLVEEGLEELGSQEWRSAVEDEDVAVEALERRPCGGDRVAGASGLLLDCERRAGRKGAVQLAPRRRRADDHERVGPEREDGGDRPVEQPPAQKRVEMLGRSDRIRVPRPAAITTAASEEVMDGKSRLGREDSNLRSRDQNPLPYHLATPHRNRDSLYFRSRRSAANRKTARPISTMSARVFTSTQSTGTSTARSWETAATQVSRRRLLSDAGRRTSRPRPRGSRR